MGISDRGCGSDQWPGKEVLMFGQRTEFLIATGAPTVCAGLRFHCAVGAPIFFSLRDYILRNLERLKRIYGIK